MKHFPKRNTYEASNLVFNTNTYEATSYNWWQFTRVINGQLVFNKHFYSNTTCKHQSKIRVLLNEIGIEVDYEVETKLSLDNPDWYFDAVNIKQNKITKLKLLMSNPRSNRVKNFEREREITQYEIDLSSLKRHFAPLNGLPGGI